MERLWPPGNEEWLLHATSPIPGGTGAITVFWDPPPGSGQGTNIATGLCAGINYTVTLTDFNGTAAAVGDPLKGMAVGQMVDATNSMSIEEIRRMVGLSY